MTVFWGALPHYARNTKMVRKCGWHVKTAEFPKNNALHRPKKNYKLGPRLFVKKNFDSQEIFPDNPWNSWKGKKPFSNPAIVAQCEKYLWFAVHTTVNKWFQSCHDPFMTSWKSPWGRDIWLLCIKRRKASIWWDPIFIADFLLCETTSSI